MRFHLTRHKRSSTGTFLKSPDLSRFVEPDGKHDKRGRFELANEALREACLPTQGVPCNVGPEGV
jgi:hypothetical protein